MPLAVLVGPFKDERLWRFFVALGTALWWWVVFLSTSRGTMLGLAFGVLLVIVLLGRSALPWLKIVIQHLIYGGLVWALLSGIVPWLLLDEVNIRALKTDSSGRMPLFIEALSMSFENFPFGMGPQSWLTHAVLTDEYERSPKFAHPHNMYLMWAAEYGWLLISALLVLVAQASRLFWRRRREARSHGGSQLALPLAGFTASVSSALLHAGVSAVFIAPGSMMVGFVVLSTFWAIIAADALPHKSEMPLGRALSAGSVGLLLGLICYVWLSEVANYHKAMDSDQQFYFDNVPEGRLPRFWFHGNFPRRSELMPR
nr:O-antigen ligase family protein [Marinobacter sp. S0848L]